MRDESIPAPRVDHASDSKKHVPALDGLRALAILAVMAVHCGFPFADLGWLGVELFFVLSGFLITTLLLDEYNRHGRIHLLQFWGRRLLRLMPAYWFYAAGLTIAMCVFQIGDQNTHGGWSPNDYIRSIWLYYINLVPQGGIWSYQELSLHLWSLAVEEQFYLIWPVLFLIFLRLGIAEVIAWALAVATLIYTMFSSSLHLASLTVRGFPILLGCAVAIRMVHASKLHSYLRKRTVSECCIGVSCFIGVAATIAVKMGMSSESAHRYVAPVMSITFAMLIASLWYGQRGPLSRILEAKPAVYIGRISYGLYLYHMLALMLTWEVLLKSADSWNQWLKYGSRLVVYAALTLAIASASYYLLEKPFLRLKARLRSATDLKA